MIFVLLLLLSDLKRREGWIRSDLAGEELLPGEFFGIRSLIRPV